MPSLDVLEFTSGPSNLAVPHVKKVDTEQARAKASRRRQIHSQPVAATLERPLMEPI
jgi:hypothetical protein